MIEVIELNNFQVHKKCRIELSDKVNCITGATDKGKSSVIRALRWCLTNQPRGDGFIRHGSTFTKVSTYLDKHKITRERSSSKNQYILDDDYENPFEAFGAERVPDQLVKLINVSDVNFSLQHDPIFWFSLTPGQVSKELNKIIALDQIDSTLANLAADLKLAKATVTVTEIRLAEAQTKLDSLNWTVEADEKLKQIEDIEETCLQTSQKRVRLRSIIEDISTLILEQSNVSKRFNSISSILQTCDKLFTIQNKRKLLYSLTLGIKSTEIEVSIQIPDKEIEKIDKVSNLVKLVKNKRIRLNELVEKIETTKKLVEVVIPDEETDKIDKLVDRLDIIREKQNKLACLVSSIERGEKEKCQAEKELQDIQKEITKNLNGRCPVCSQEWLPSVHQIPTFGSSHQ